VKKFRQRERGGPLGCPGDVQIHAAKTGAGFSVAGPVFIKGLIIELIRPKSVSVSVSVSERKTSSFTDTDTHTHTVSGDGDVVIIMRPLITH